MKRVHRLSAEFSLLVFLIVLAICRGDAIVAHGLINHDALLGIRRGTPFDCPWAIDWEMRCGQRALDADMTALAMLHRDRMFFMSGRIPCSSVSAHWENSLSTDDQWGRFVVSEGELTREELSIWLSMWAWGNNWRLVKGVAGASTERHPDQLFGYYYLARAWVHEDNIETALDVYASALERFPDSALLCREIARLYHHRLGDSAKALYWYQASLKRNPDEPTALLGIAQLAGNELRGLTDDQMRQLEALGFVYPITRWTEGIFADGYTLDEDLYAFSHGVDIELYEFWDNSPQDVQPLPGWFQMGKWWIARDRTQNLAPNPRFVWDRGTGEAMMPLGYRAEHGIVTALADYAIVEDQRGEEAISCAQLLNDTWNDTRLVTPLISVGSTCYLQAGWIKTYDGGNAYIGYRWLGDSVAKPDYNYVAVQVQVLDWAHYAGVAVPLPGAQSVSLRLLNNLSDGTAWFNDVLFVPVACR